MPKCKLCRRGRNVMYGLPGGPCEYHSVCRPSADYINLYAVRCAFGDCMTEPTYGFGGSPTHCKKHVELGMAPVYHNKLCQTPNCERRATFGHASTGERNKVISCGEHATPDMVKWYGPSCTECGHSAGFGRVGEKATRCAAHATDEMTLHYRRVCDVIDCEATARYALTHDELPIRCHLHRDPGMVNKHGPKCIVCRAPAYYGTTSRYCRKHKPDGMTTVRHLCEIPGCGVGAGYGLRGGRPQRCKQHMTPEMDNLAHAPRRCREAGCEANAIPNKRHGRCPAHCPAPRRYNVCEADGCNKYAGFSWPGTMRSHCATHMLSGMTRYNAKSCLIPGCTTTPNFGFDGGKRTYCSTHKQSGMINLGRRAKKK